MHWGKQAEDPKVPDRSVLWVNDRCRLVGVPPEALEYQVSGRSPLDWAIDSLRRKEDKKSALRGNVGGWVGVKSLGLGVRPRWNR